MSTDSPKSVPVVKPSNNVLTYLQKTELIDEIVRDLRNPLFGLVACMDYISEVSTSIELSQFESKVLDANKCLNTMKVHISNVSDLFRITDQNDIGSLSISNVNLFDIINEIYVLIGDKIRSDGNSFYCYCPREYHETIIRSDRYRMKQVIVTLLNHVSERGKGGTVKLNVETTHDEIKVIVGDDSKEMSSEELSEVRKKIEGVSGKYGLYVSNVIAKKFGGSIRVESGNGNRFVFTMSGLEHVKYNVDESNKSVAEMKESVKVVIAEDNALVQNVYHMFMEGYNYVMFDDGDVLLEYLKKDNDVDIIILDLMMPRMNGDVCSKLLRAEYKYKGPILCVSAGNEDISYDLQHFDEFIQKPIRKSDLFSKIEKWVARKPIVPKENRIMFPTVSKNLPLNTELIPRIEVKALGKKNTKDKKELKLFIAESNIVIQELFKTQLHDFNMKIVQGGHGVFNELTEDGNSLNQYDFIFVNDDLKPHGGAFYCEQVIKNDYKGVIIYLAKRNLFEKHFFHYLLRPPYTRNYLIKAMNKFLQFSVEDDEDTIYSFPNLVKIEPDKEEKKDDN